eukprot:GHVL01010795.1.p1 GENE.GHVL01010795.1~~GHVL01010795.1.p1  ORF type:complete len:1063 (+),score=224.63 GHVL01010795.1:747-3935(+)
MSCSDRSNSARRESRMAHMKNAGRNNQWDNCSSQQWADMHSNLHNQSGQWSAEQTFSDNRMWEKRQTTQQYDPQNKYNSRQLTAGHTDSQHFAPQGAQWGHQSSTLKNQWDQSVGHDSDTCQSSTRGWGNRPSHGGQWDGKQARAPEVQWNSRQSSIQGGQCNKRRTSDQGQLDSRHSHQQHWDNTQSSIQSEQWDSRQSSSQPGHWDNRQSLTQPAQWDTRQLSSPTVQWDSHQSSTQTEQCKRRQKSSQQGQLDSQKGSNQSGKLDCSQSSTQPRQWDSRQSTAQPGQWDTRQSSAQGGHWDDHQQSTQSGQWNRRQPSTHPGQWDSRQLSAHLGQWDSRQSSEQPGQWNNPQSSTQPGQFNRQSSTHPGQWDRQSTAQSGQWDTRQSPTQQIQWNSHPSSKQAGHSKPGQWDSSQSSSQHFNSRPSLKQGGEWDSSLPSAPGSQWNSRESLGKQWESDQKMKIQEDFSQKQWSTAHQLPHRPQIQPDWSKVPGTRQVPVSQERPHPPLPAQFLANPTLHLPTQSPPVHHTPPPPPPPKPHPDKLETNDDDSPPHNRVDDDDIDEEDWKNIYSNDAPEGPARGGHNSDEVADDDEEEPVEDVRFLPRLNVGEKFDEIIMAANVEVMVKDSLPMPVPLKSFGDGELMLGTAVVMNLQKQGFVTPTPVQQWAIPLIHEKRSILCEASTGTGKTLAFVGPFVGALLSRPESDWFRPYFPGKAAQASPLALLMVPTRELAVQIHEQVEWLTDGTTLKTMAVFGGENMGDQVSRICDSQVDVLTGTPGRLLDLLDASRLSLQFVRFVALDEADQMLSLGFEKQMRSVLFERDLPECSEMVHALLSATLPPEIRSISGQLIGPHVEIRVEKTEAAKNANIIQEIRWVEDRDKLAATLFDVGKLSSIGKAIVFTSSRAFASTMRSFLVKNGVAASCLHGKMDQSTREEVFREFRTGTSKVLVATSVAARGLDFPDVLLVIQVDLPKALEFYIHRIGRTGRAGKEGKAVAYYNSSNKSIGQDLSKFLLQHNQQVPSFLAGPRRLPQPPDKRRRGGGCRSPPRRCVGRY